MLVWLSCATAALLIALITTAIELRRTRRRLAIAFRDPAYGVLTRAGGEHAWRRVRRSTTDIIFLDLDDLHVLNAQLGYAEVDRRIATALSAVAHDCLIPMRWYSGDELVFVVPIGAGERLADRVRAHLHEQYLSGTFAVVHCLSHDLRIEVARAAALVQAAKAAHWRDVIVTPDSVTGPAHPHATSSRPLLAPAELWALLQAHKEACYTYLATLQPHELAYAAEAFAAFARSASLCETTPQAILDVWARRIAARRPHGSCAS